MRKYIRIGVDIAKNSFQVHALESEDCSATKLKLSRSGIVKFLAEGQAVRDRHGGLRLGALLGAAVSRDGPRRTNLCRPIDVKPYVKRGKNDAADAAAICEAMSRPNMRFVAVKSEDQQATLMAHKTRELLIKQRTTSVPTSRWRGHLAEFLGAIAAKGIGHVEELVEHKLPPPTFRRWSRRCSGFCLRNCGLSTRRSTSSSARSSPTIDAIRSAGWRRASPASARSPLRR